MKRSLTGVDCIVLSGVACLIAGHWAYVLAAYAFSAEWLVASLLVIVGGYLLMGYGMTR